MNASFDSSGDLGRHGRGGQGPSAAGPTLRDGEALAVETHGLTKSYGKIEALRGVDLRVRRGEIYGFLGRNGAGKTTTIRILLGLIRADSGFSRIFGSSLEEERRAILGQIGYFVESASAYPNLTVRENLDIQRRLTSAPRDSVGQAIELLRLEEAADRRAGTLSLGNKQRLSIARALLHRPRLLILDEPVNGLDPAGIIEIRDLLRRLSDEDGITIFMSSHNLSEVDKLADRIGIVHRGRVIEELDAEELRSKAIRALEIDVDDRDKAEAILRERLRWNRIERRGTETIRIEDEGMDAAEAARGLVGAGLALRRLLVIGEGLEEYFMRVTGGEE